jgi:polysaccharide export outer membrane protein
LALGDQFSLKPHDIVWVDATGLARWNRVVNLLAPSVGLYNSLMQSVYYTKGITE